MYIAGTVPLIAVARESDVITFQYMATRVFNLRNAIYYYIVLADTSSGLSVESYLGL